MPGTLAKNVAEFQGAFGAKPTHGARAPGRVNLIGDHTDYTGGLVLPMAIDLDCFAVGRSNGLAQVRVRAVDLGEAAAWSPAEDAIAVRDRLRAGKQPWATYVLGVLTVASTRYPAAGELLRGGLDIAIASDVPLGSGLSSSASLEMSVLTLVELMVGAGWRAIDKALVCQEAEHRFAGVPCGIMDMLTSAAGLSGHAILIDCKTNQVLPAPLPSPELARVVVINSNAKHELSGGEYAKRRAGCERAAMLLGISSLREAQEDPVGQRRLPEELRPLVRHVVSENHRVTNAFDALHRVADNREQLSRLGVLMDASHDSLRDDYRVSCVELDTLVELLRNTPGVFGARMTGGGFGGSVVALATPEALPAIAAEVPGRYRDVHGRLCSILTPAATDGAGAVTLG